MEGFVNVSEAAKLIGVSNETLRRWDKNGKFTSARHPINNYRVYHIETVYQFIKELQLQIKYKTQESVKENNEIKNIIERVQFEKPVFETAYGKLFNIDAIKFMKSIEDESIDLIFADPPYNIKKAEWDSFDSQHCA